MKISHLPGPVVLGVDGDDDALGAELLRGLAPRTPGRSTAAVLIETLSAPASSSLRMSSTVRTPPPTVSGMKHCSAVRAHHVEEGVAVLVRGGDVEEAQLVGAGRVVDARLLDRVAGVAQVDEVDALDDAAVLHVEAGNDADLEHGQLPAFVIGASSSASARSASMRPS